MGLISRVSSRTYRDVRVRKRKVLIWLDSKAEDIDMSNQARSSTTQTVTSTEQQSSTLRLNLAPPSRRVMFTEETIDNENLNKKKTKKCCIFHKPKQHFDDTSSEESDSSDDDVNAYERLPKSQKRDKIKALNEKLNMSNKDNKPCNHIH